MTTLNLTPFCGRETTRNYLMAPFSIGAYTYATNGHIAIRVPRRDDVPEVDGVPISIETLFARLEALPLTYRTLSLTLPPEALPKCSTCRGVGYGGRCPRCHGEGTHDCDCDYCERECDDCDGGGIVFRGSDVAEAERQVCAACDGTGRQIDTRNVLFPNLITLKARYLRLVLALPGPIEMAQRAPDDTVEQFTVGRHPEQVFRFAGGLVLVMPCRPGWDVNADIIVSGDVGPGAQESAPADQQTIEQPTGTV